MRIDALAKRYAPLFVCLMLGIAAYFQASGLGQILGAILAPASGVSPWQRHDTRPLALGSDRDTSAAAILERNPFDSVTGPLNDPGIPLPSGGDHSPGADGDPYRDPPCDVVRAVLIASSDDPAWSFAAIVGPDGKTQLRRRGEDFYGGKVTFVGDQRPADRREGDERGLWDRVWLTAPNGQRCQLQLGVKPAPRTGPPPHDAGAPPGGPPSDIRGKIRRVHEHEFEVDRSAVEAIIASPAELMKTRVVPEKEGDRVVGLKLFGINPSSLLGTLGIENGDRLTSINGFEMNDPQKMLEAYSKLLRADHLTASVVRNGKPVNLEFNIK